MNKPSSWASHFGLDQNPFKDTIATDLFFRTRQHEEAVIKIKMGFEDQHALILLTGVSGTGKTLASQVVLRSLDQECYAPVFVFVFPGMGRGALLGTILSELDIEPARFVHDRLGQIHDRALELAGQGRRLVVIIDEAHFLKADALHVLRTLSNLETEQEKLITVLLVAEKSIAKRLRAPSYASLRGRITFAVQLDPLDPLELEQYVKFRLLKCGGNADLLSSDVFQIVHKYSGGIPREVNRLLYAGFIEAMAANEPVSVDIIKAAVNKMGVISG